jgi:hypothetical protein
MGGPLSGRRRWKNYGSVEQHLSLDVNNLNRAGSLKPGSKGHWRWIRDGEVSAWIDILRVGYDYLDLSYPAINAEGLQYDVRQTICLVRVPCNFGGNRVYFRCVSKKNGPRCQKLVTKLFRVGLYFHCRHCERLSYESQSKDVWERAYRRTVKIRMRLGAEPGSFKPKGMHWRTFEKLKDELFKAEAKREERFALFEARFSARS